MPPSETVTHKLGGPPSSSLKIFAIIILLAILAGTGTGYFLASSNKSSARIQPEASETAKHAQSDTQTFRDFAEGTVVKKPEPKKGEQYTEGTHMLQREKQNPVALTSSVVDLSQYEGKKVKVYGETQKALKEGWLMDVGRVEVQ